LAINDAITYTLLFRGISKEDILNSTKEEISLMMIYDKELQKREMEKMKKMMGG